MPTRRPSPVHAPIRALRGLLVLLGLAPLVALPAAAETKDMFGWIERVTITEMSRGVKAKLDSGDRTSSMHAENILPFKKGDIQMVRFDIVDPDAGDEPSLRYGEAFPGIVRQVEILQMDQIVQVR